MAEELMDDGPPPEEGGAPGWMVTFGDMMSLLLTFFIMLLSMATIDIVKYRQVVESFESSFGVTDVESAQFEKPQEISEQDIKSEEDAMRLVVEKLVDVVQDSQIHKFVKIEVQEDGVKVTGKMTETQEAQKITELISKVQSVVESEDFSEDVKVVMDNRGLAIRLKDKALFDSGKAKIKKASRRVLYKIGKLMKHYPGSILIEGHTDNIPIRTRQYPSNWELSSARAASICRFVLKYSGVDSKKVQVAGAADTRPLAPNDSNENRAKNRRVEFIFLRDK